jgi:hypothetical protein
MDDLFDSEKCLLRWMEDDFDSKIMLVPEKNLLTGNDKELFLRDRSPSHRDCSLHSRGFRYCKCHSSQLRNREG